ncbi:hypothetical protein B296_00051992 [Ensete ventricosum]|uniref:Uncharacterized protein n=1 Tax=Ensete ventricosum TaxID=4639 RepID=A0A426YE78_ENSVE|nr:hypothetical protein B296_00051992 [Ensete ventricosum]
MIPCSLCSPPNTRDSATSSSWNHIRQPYRCPPLLPFLPSDCGVFSSTNGGGFFLSQVELGGRLSHPSPHPIRRRLTGTDCCHRVPRRCSLQPLLVDISGEIRKNGSAAFRSPSPSPLSKPASAIFATPLMAPARTAVRLLPCYHYRRTVQTAAITALSTLNDLLYGNLVRRGGAVSDHRRRRQRSGWRRRRYAGRWGRLHGLAKGSRMMRIGGDARSGGELARSYPVFSIRSGGDCFDSKEAAGNTVEGRRSGGGGSSNYIGIVSMCVDVSTAA